MAGGALPGFRDFYPDEFAHRAHIMRAWREVARRYAFVEYDGPPLEPLELYTKKSGDEIVGQLYEFTDKGDRHVALRPEMTPTFARMVGARANALRKPIRWFSIPQLFRYERQQKGRLKEHFQLNVDIVGEASELADAELLAVAIDVMRELGLTSADVRARVSDRTILRAILRLIGVTDEVVPAVFAAVDKFGRAPDSENDARLGKIGLNARQVDDLLAATAPTKDALEFLSRTYGHDAEVRARLDSFGRYFGYLTALGVSDSVDLDLRIVRGLDYYTGIVFELFDIHGEFRAICGGGRYDHLIEASGGPSLPACGFGMGDVVLGEILKERGKMDGVVPLTPDLFVIGGPGSTMTGIHGALQLVGALRRAGCSVDYGLSEKKYQTPPRGQFEAAQRAGALAAVFYDEGNVVTVKGLGGKRDTAPQLHLPQAAVLGGDAAVTATLQQFIHSLRS